MGFDDEVLDVRLQRFPAPGGVPLSVAVAEIDGTDTVVAAGFTDDLIGSSDQQLRVVDDEIGPISDRVRAWCSGDFDALAGIPVRQPGSDFRQQVWAELAGVPAGVTVTYGELAESVGRPRAARAVGTACARNEIAPFIPCHRVVPASGGVGNYGYRPELKTELLRLESAGAG